MSPIQIIATTGGIILANILVWVFMWGRRTGRVNQRLNNLENSASGQILPECSAIFTEIKEKLSNLDGKVDVLLQTMKENPKNEERTDRQE